MTEYANRNPKQETEQARQPQTTEQLLLTAIQLWMLKRRRGLPEPCPMQPEACAAWWTQHMQKPDEDAVVQCNALLRFLDLPDNVDRQFVIVAVKDGIPYRGDNLDIFCALHEETQSMRKAPDKYRDATLHSLSVFLSNARNARHTPGLTAFRTEP